MNARIKIERGVPVPERRFHTTGNLCALRNAMKNMAPGDSFLWGDNKSAYDAANQIGVKIKTRKSNGDGYRVWRIA